MSDRQRPTRCLVTGATSAVGQATAAALAARGWDVVPPGADVADPGLGPLDVLVDLGADHPGHVALTGLLLPALVASADARVVTVTSIAARLGRVADLLFTCELDRRARAAGWPITAVAAHPGWVATDPSRSHAIGLAAGRLVAQSPEEGARPLVRAATQPGLAGASYVAPGGPLQLTGAPRLVAMPHAARDPERAARLWEASERATGVRFGLG